MPIFALNTTVQWKMICGVINVRKLIL